MSIPISRGSLDCLLNFRPGSKAATFERQRSQRLPPRLDQVEIECYSGENSRVNFAAATYSIFGFDVQESPA